MTEQQRMARPLAEVDPEVYAAINKELDRQNTRLELIASENFTSEAILEATGSVMTNKYAEGYPGRRYYGGCENIDVVENLARDRARKLFNADYANVQPHSGSQANEAAYAAVLKPGDTILGMNLAHGGHLTHGHPLNFSGKTYRIVPYGVRKDDERIDYDEVTRLAEEHKPKMIIAGGSAYPRIIDFAKFRAVADSAGALLLVDMAHFSGLVAGGVYPNPCEHADIVTSTTHKTLRGPRSGMILAKHKMMRDSKGKDILLGDLIDKAVFPGAQGGPLCHVIAAKAVCFLEALTPEFRDYQARVKTNAEAMAQGLIDAGFRVVSGGTDSHLVLLDVFSKGVRGKEAEHTLDEAYITVNKNAIPFDVNPPLNPSGIRLGSPAVTTRGFGQAQMREVAGLVAEVVGQLGADSTKIGTTVTAVRRRVAELTERFPLYGWKLSAAAAGRDSHPAVPSSPLRIIMDARHVRDFGIGTYIRGLLQGLAEVGQANRYVIVTHPNDRAQLPALPGNFETASYPRRDLEKADHIAFPAFLKRLEGDLFHITLNRVPWFMPHPYVVTVHDMSRQLSAGSGWRNQASLYRARRGLTRAERVISVSHATQRNVEACLGLSTTNFRVIPSAPDPRFASRPADASQERLRQLERFQVNYPFILYAGHISPRKNVPRLIEAFAVVRTALADDPRYRDLRLIVVGDEIAQHPEVRRAATYSRLEQAIRFFGYVPFETLRAFYESATLFAFPSLHEGFGLAPLEAMACGTPVVTSNCSSLPEVVGEAAMLVNPDNVFDIARGIREVLEDDALRGRMVQDGLRQVSRFSWARTAGQVLEVYREARSRS